MSDRRSRRVLWELMSQLEEAGEEDICSLLNEVMSAQPYYGTGEDLHEYLDALAVGESLGQLRLREYRIEDGRTVHGDVITTDLARGRTAFSFDTLEAAWRWRSSGRIVVEVRDE